MGRDFNKSLCLSLFYAQDAQLSVMPFKKIIWVLGALLIIILTFYFSMIAGLVLLAMLIIIIGITAYFSSRLSITQHLTYWVWVNKLWIWRQLASILRFFRFSRMAAICLVKCAHLLEKAKRLDLAANFFREATINLSNEPFPNQKRTSLNHSIPRVKGKDKHNLPRLAPSFFRTTGIGIVSLYQHRHLMECIQLDLAAIFLRLNDPVQAKGVFGEIEHFSAQDDQLLKGRIAATQAEYFRVVNYLPKAGPLIEQALKDLQSSGTMRDTYLASLIAGFIFLHRGDLIKAHDYLNIAREGFSDLSEAESLAKAIIGLGRIQIEKQDYHQALKHYKSALKYAEESQLSINLMWKVYWGLGFIYDKLDHHHTSIQYLEKAVEAVQKSKIPLTQDGSKVQYSDNASPVLDDLIFQYAEQGKRNPALYEECRFLIEATRGSSLTEVRLQRKRGELLFMNVDKHLKSIEGVTGPSSFRMIKAGKFQLRKVISELFIICCQISLSFYSSCQTSLP